VRGDGSKWVPGKLDLVANETLYPFPIFNQFSPEELDRLVRKEELSSAALKGGYSAI
jgi:hypothetical protein